MSLNDIDFAERYRQHMQAAGWRRKSADDWDRRAEGYRARPDAGGYGRQLLARINLEGINSLLDVGCGPGDLTLPLARQVPRLVAVDFSQAMLDLLQQQAAREGIDNIHTVQRAWEECWDNIPARDLVLASRSTGVEDLQVLLDKLASHARRRVCLTQLAGGHFIDPDILTAIGQPAIGLPDHIYTLNLLHQQGIYPTVDYLEVPSRMAGCTDFEQFAERLAWSSGELTPAQRRNLLAWYNADPERAHRGGRPVRWAMLQWDVV